MELPNLKHDFYNALVDAADIGPRQELNLSMELWQGNRSRGEGRLVSIRFGGIVNFDEVQAFFTAFQSSANAQEGLHWLRYDVTRKSKPNDLFIKMQFDRTGEEVLIHCKNITISD